PCHSSRVSSAWRSFASSVSRTATAAARSGSSRIASGLWTRLRSSPRRRSLPTELRRPASVVSREPLGGVVSFEQALLQLTLPREPLLEPDLQPGRHRAFDETYRARRLGRRNELARILERGAAEPVRGNVEHRIDEAE